MLSEGSNCWQNAAQMKPSNTNHFKNCFNVFGICWTSNFIFKTIRIILFLVTRLHKKTFKLVSTITQDETLANKKWISFDSKTVACSGNRIYFPLLHAKNYLFSTKKKSREVHSFVMCMCFGISPVLRDQLLWESFFRCFLQWNMVESKTKYWTNTSFVFGVHSWGGFLS